MKLFKKLFLVIPLLFSIASCSGNESIAGTYSFQLGSTEGTHGGITLNLTDEVVQGMEIEDATPKRFEMIFNIGFASDNTMVAMLTHMDVVLEYLRTHEIVPENIDQILAEIEKAIEESTDKDTPLTLGGYYYLQDVENAKGKDETRVMMGLDIKISTEGFVIPPEVLNNVLYATYSNDTVSVIIPVSARDLLYQIYWYGYRISFSPVAPYLNVTDLHEESPDNTLFDHHMVGSHPTEDEVERIVIHQNLRSEADPKPADYFMFEEIYRYYYNYHTLTMGLAKDGSK